MSRSGDLPLSESIRSIDLSSPPAEIAAPHFIRPETGALGKTTANKSVPKAQR